MYTDARIYTADRLLLTTGCHGSLNNDVLTMCKYLCGLITKLPVKVAARSKACTSTVFVRSNAGIVGSNPAQGLDVCVV
jgi:hypothetical protein